jgi:hypothetical protein
VKKPILVICVAIQRLQNIFRKDSSREINWETLGQLMVSEYQSHPQRIRVPADGYQHTLRGVRILASHVRMIIDQASCQEVMLFFAVRADDLGKPDAQQFFTIVLAGIDTNNNLMTNEHVYDYCDPCPKNCPHY